MILFEDGQKIGEISDWKVTERFAEKRMVLGKEILMQKPKDACEFVSPKPVNWKKPLWIVDGKTKLTLSDVRVTGGTQITATVADRTRA